MNIHAIYGKVSPIFRRKRMALFTKQLAPTKDTRILDVGGYPGFWAESGVSSNITILNLHVLPGTAKQYEGVYALVLGDGTNLQYPDRAFDLLFSNSVIEHLGTYEQQVKFAREARRVGKDLWIQTPARSFFIEPHLLAPFIHWLPRSMQKRLARHFTLWGWITKPNKETVHNFIEETRLLNEAEMRALFPDCEIRREKLLGFTKSYVAVRKTAK